MSYIQGLDFEFMLDLIILNFRGIGRERREGRLMELGLGIFVGYFFLFNLFFFHFVLSPKSQIWQSLLNIYLYPIKIKSLFYIPNLPYLITISHHLSLLLLYC